MENTPPTPEQQPASRAEIYNIIADAVAGGLPAPHKVDFFDHDSFDIQVTNAAEVAAWMPVFGMTAANLHGQPKPLTVPPEQFVAWLTTNWTNWRGWYVALRGKDPITDEHRRQWIESGGPERHPAAPAAESGDGDA